MRAAVVATEDRVVLGQMIRRGSVIGIIDTELPLDAVLGGALDLRVRIESAPAPVAQPEPQVKRKRGRGKYSNSRPMESNA